MGNCYSWKVLLRLFNFKMNYKMKIFQCCLFVAANLFLVVNTYAKQKIDPCNSSRVVVSYNKIEDYHMACKAVSDVIEVAKKIGLSYELNINISLVDRLINNNTGKALAIFNPNTMEIQVLSIKACEKTLGNAVILGQKIDKELHRSLLVHELAHALFWKNKGNKFINREIHEYFAYIIQLALLDEPHRSQIISSSNIPPFASMSEITEDYYLLNPTRFAVKSYLHFENINNDWTILQRIFKE